MRCPEWQRVLPDLVREARGTSAAECVDGAVQCQMSAHVDGEHYGLLDDDGEPGTARWLRWLDAADGEPVVLPDCPVVSPGPDGEGCCLFVGHAERHTWEDPP
ncbi:hypothetical protein ACIQPQ_13770 [Streptomyces sp. NPDC091281]|uniref:hypothetical protein n=1 Tax=Streptomyces sp. NPDC091281 TaxID=3365985 RepID=UPI00380DF443